MILLILLLIPFQSLAADNLIFTEVQISGESTNQSYIKIHNPNQTAIDLSGYKLRKKSSTGKEYSLRVFPKESFVSPQGYFVWANSRDDYHLFLNADVYSTGSITKNNSVALFSPQGEIIDALAWGNGENQFFLGECFPLNPEKNIQIKRIKNDFYQNTGNNAQDFVLSSQESLSAQNYQTVETFLDKETNFPLTQGLSTSLFLGFLALFFKKPLIQKNGRT
jgi:hypothetical protein